MLLIDIIFQSHLYCEAGVTLEAQWNYTCFILVQKYCC